MPVLVRAQPTPSVSITLELPGGHVTKLVGMAFGYYLLCAIRPEANVLGLRLPYLPLPSAVDPTR